MYPDATGTLRLAYGVVRGYEQDGQQIPPWTTIGGAFDDEQKHDAVYPYQLPESWKKSHDKLKLDTPLDFVSTADITNGNSGSPVVNRAGDLVGIIFDSNRQGVANNYAYTDVQARAVSVDSRAVIETLKNVYGADALLDELLGQSASRIAWSGEPNQHPRRQQPARISNVCGKLLLASDGSQARITAESPVVRASSPH